MKNKVWILNHYAGFMAFDRGGRHYSLAKYLQRKGYEPVVFCCNVKHASNTVNFYQMDGIWEEHVSEEIKTPFVFVKARLYNSSLKKRVLNILDFYCNVKKTAKEYALQNGKPDIIIASSVHPLTLVAGIQLARFFNVKCICEVRDFWPESIIAYNIARKNNIIVRALYILEKWIYKKADALIFTVEGGKDYIIEKGWDEGHGGSIDLNKIHHINNGVDLEEFDYNKAHYILEDKDLCDSELFKVVYTGSIRHVNNMGMLIDVAQKVKNPHIRFLIWGDGDERDVLEQRTRDENINNVVFKGKVDKKYIPSIVSRADLNLMDMQESSDIFRFGISPNKLFEYFAARKPCLMYQLNYYNPAMTYHVGYNAQTKQDIIDCIESLSLGKNWGETIIQNNLEAACHAYSYQTLAEKLQSVIESV